MFNLAARYTRDEKEGILELSYFGNIHMYIQKEFN